jgi:ribonuclease P protein component
MNQRFPKQEKLCSQKDIDRLFESGKQVRAGSVLIKYMPLEPDAAPPHAKVLMVVPKRAVKKAVRRNRIKRLLREAYRLHKLPLTDFVAKANKTIHFAVICNDGKVDSLESASRWYCEALRKMIDHIKRGPNTPPKPPQALAGNL